MTLEIAGGRFDILGAAGVNVAVFKDFAVKLEVPEEYFTEGLADLT